MCGLLDDLVSTPLEALVEEWYATVTRATDTIAPKHPLQCLSPSGFMVQSIASGYEAKQEEAEEHLEFNLKAAQVMSSIYLAKVKPRGEHTSLSRCLAHKSGQAFNDGMGNDNH